MSHTLATTIEPLYILEEHIAAEAVTLRAKRNGKGGFTFSTNSKDSPSKVLYTVDSRSGLGAPRRLIKDAAGEGILELWRNATGHDSYIGRPKGVASPPLAVIAPRKTVSKDKVDVYVKKAAGASNEELKLEVRGQDIWKRNTVVYSGNDIVMQLGFVNYITSYVPFSNNQWDVIVAQGFDLSLVSACLGWYCRLQFILYLTFVTRYACTIVAYLGTTLYDSSSFRSRYGLEGSTNEDKDTLRKSWTRSAILYGAAAGAATGAAGSSS